MSGGRMIRVGTVVFLLLWLLRKRLPVKVQRSVLAAVTGLLMGSALISSFTWPFLVICLLILGCLVVYAARGWQGSGAAAALRCRENKDFVWATAGAAVLFFLFVSVWTVCRVRSFSVPTFDFGIFSQMFHSMKTTGLPITTVERDGALSHFAVHVSPIYYHVPGRGHCRP